MLKHLYIQNFTLIDRLDIDFQSGFSVITGETGAGKSIILGAIGMLLGNRADSKSVKLPLDKQDDKPVKCTIEAHFDLSRYDLESFFQSNDIDYDATDTIIRRELLSTGKSRAFINDEPVSLQTMKRLGEQLIDVHSQHQNLLLQKDNFQLNVVDIIANDKEALDDYAKSYHSLVNKQNELERLRQQIEKDTENRAFLEFQYNELSQAQLVDGMQEQLEQESETLSHAEDIKTALYQSNQWLSDDEKGIVPQLKRASDALQQIVDVYPQVKELTERLNSAYVEIDDIASEVSGDVDNIDFDPSTLDAINSKLDQIYALEQKFHVNTIADLLQLQEQLQEQLAHIENSDEALSEIQQEVNQLQTVCTKKARHLTELREKAAVIVEKEMKDYLVPLGIPNVQFRVDVTPKDLAIDGADKVQFLFSANRSTQLQPVSQVASGGEIARVMLSLKAMISGAIKLPTIIFDEIDTGVSGKIAEKMAYIMQTMGNNGRQVISITHLPQIAAMGRQHYKVEKIETEQGTQSHMSMLSDEERVEEIAKMLSGENITEAALNNARELLGFPIN